MDQTESGPRYGYGEPGTLREPFPATGEAFSVPLSGYPTPQDAADAEPAYGFANEAGIEREHRNKSELGPLRPRGGADPVSIGSGLVFLLLGGAYLLASGGHLTVNAGWTLSFLLLGLGLSGVVGSVLRSRLESRGRARSRN